MIVTQKVSSMVFTLALGLAACGGNRSLPPKGPPAASSLAEAQEGSSGSEEATPGQGTSHEQAGTVLTEDQIIAVISVVDSGEINRARLAETLGTNSEVKELAERIANGHLEQKNKQAELAQRLHLSPAETPTARQIESDGERVTEALRAKQGPDFDRAYVDAEIREHLSLLDLIDRKLMPGAETAELRRLLKDYRSRVEAHLIEAQNAQKDLASGK